MRSDAVRRAVTVRTSANSPSTELVAAVASIGIDLVVYDDGPSALVAVGSQPPGLMVLPTDIHGTDPIEFVDAVAHLGHTPVVVAVADEAVGRATAVIALGRGARGIVGLPLAPGELVAAMRELQPASAPTLVAGDLVMDLSAHRVTVAGHAVAFTAREFRLLQLLLDSGQRVVALQDLGSLVTDLPEASISGIRVMIGRIRRKLAETSPTSADILETVRGVGYRISLHDKAE